MKKHDYHPEVFTDVFGSAASVLTISPGDHVMTSTVDAHGFDANMNRLMDSINALTGPFYIESAEPGDTLVVDIHSLTPNRNTGWTTSVVSHGVVDSAYVKNLPQKEYVEWDIDLEKETATPASGNSAVHSLQFPIRPMLGCIGVAPRDGQKISTWTSAEHGGNMDYFGVVKGTRMYFPVFVKGALLGLGDGHALQGHGELGGSGVETSLDVHFSVNVEKKSIHWPRGENDEYIFSIGNARPLMQSLQHAVTEMMRWLKDEYGLDENSASILISQVTEIDIGNVFDPAYTAVCKLPKSFLPS